MDTGIDTGANTSASLVTLQDRTLPTPRLELDVGRAVDRFRQLARVLRGAHTRYAVKANPHPVLIRALADEGCGFDVASPVEVGVALAGGARPEHLIHSNPVARRDHLRACGRVGVPRYVVDSLAEVAKLGEAVPGAEVLVRIATSGVGSDGPLSCRFGVPAGDAIPLLVSAAEHDLVPAGVAFHVGSQQRDSHAWTAPIAAAADVFTALARLGLTLSTLDLGGGFPADHLGGAPPLETYGTRIDRALSASFGAARPEILLGPGRGIVGDAGTLVSRVIGVVHRGGRRWVHLDAGVFTGLVETRDEAIRYRLATDGAGPVGPCVLAGPTGAGADVLYEKQPVLLPLRLAEGDEVRFLSAGAYTSGHSTAGPDGLQPLPTVLV